jgi:putative spermidine/putrescine transport system permease protein
MPDRRFTLLPWLIVAPALIVFVVVFAIPVVQLLLTSLERINTSTFAVIERFTLYNYVKFLSDEFYLSVLWVTIRIGLVVTLICAVLGYPVALYLGKAGPRERGILMLLIVSPLVVSLVIRSLGWLIILGRRGVIDWLAAALGLGGGINLLHTETSVVIGLAHIFYPFMVLAIYGALQNIDPAMMRAAANLGASPFRAFCAVTLPLSVPGLLAGSLIVFALSVSSFVTPALLGGPWVKVAAYLVWEQTLQILDWSFAAAIATILLIVTGAIMYAYKRIAERSWFAGVFQ